MKEFNLALKLAKICGNNIKKSFLKEKKSRFKTKGELVTEVDELNNSIIVSNIKKYFPDHGIIAEETGEEIKDSEYKWIIDPLDGTHNFASGLPMCGVAIALLKKDQIIFGVINIPILNELYYAQNGKGAFLNGK